MIPWGVEWLSAQVLTYNGQLDGVTQDGAGVDLTLVLARVTVPHVPDDQLPLPGAQILSHHHAGILMKIFKIKVYIFRFNSFERDI